MHIGYDAKRYFHNRSGLGNYSRDLVRIMRSYYPACEYTLYTPKLPSNELPESFSVRHPEKGLLNRVLPSYWRSKGIVRDLERDGIDIFHGLSGEIPIGLQKTRIQSVVSIHDLIFLRLPELYKAMDRIIYTKKFRYAVQHADKIIAISQQTKQDIVHFFGIDHEKIDIVYQGCHPAFKQAQSADFLDGMCRKYNLPTDFILNVGSIEPRKNTFQIVKALEETDIPLVVVGKETTYSHQIKQYISARKLENQILFRKVDCMEDLAGLYKLAKVFVYPSTYEGFGIPIIEALYSGTPVVTTNSGVFPEAAGPFSYFIDPQSPENIRYAIESILSSSNMQREMKKNGLIYAQQFNDDVLAEKWMKVYGQLLHRSL